ncbi:unnamed protein product [Fraxinus pennsylvanica]|uniref:CTP synthase N-terminal domain-containing protein n=1 Tax=Fraxinus pennsylvanica TaxID=56036 RepID=A0AAD2DQZ6_9LAMI|nr:unnamed protein product [Fraxinus pennsylvanica]
MAEEEERLMGHRLKEDEEKMNEPREEPHLNDLQFTKLDELLTQTQLYSEFLLVKMDTITTYADPFLNTDAGTMSHFEHGEIYILDDGGEVVPHIIDCIQCVAHILVDVKKGPSDVCVLATPTDMVVVPCDTLAPVPEDPTVTQKAVGQTCGVKT